MGKLIKEWYNFIVVVGIITFAIVAIVPKILPNYEKYKAGEYRQSVPCEQSKPVCFFKQMEYVDKKGDTDK